MKRVFDFFTSFAILVLCVPIFIIIGIAIKLDDGGPVFFKQKRVGLGGYLFSIYKFRSMSLKPLPSKGSFEPGDSSRITCVGRFLRKTKLDELPQFLNVIIGDMAIVGPRPEVQKWIDTYPERWANILTIRPGITDSVSIRFRNEAEELAESENPELYYRNVILPQKLDYYEEYLESRSFCNDIKLIFTTLYVVVFSQNLLK